jgi:hypothetical protein
MNRAATLKPASIHDEKGRTHGLSLIFFLLERSKLTLLAIPTVFAAIVWAIGVGLWSAT